jgi:formylglycine-generating enzyme required for sulfatase activity
MNRRILTVLTGLLGAVSLLGLLAADQPAPPRRPGATWTNSIGMKFAWIPACPEGFVMGSPENEPERMADETQHRVRLSRDFLLGVHEVTQAQWKAVMGENPSYFEGDGNLPVDTVSWQDAVGFCLALGKKEGRKYRLPTEAEWEYACRAGTATPFHTGRTISTDQVNYDGQAIYGEGREGIARKRTTVVGSFRPNAWGLYDMHGNLWEWCADWYGAYPDGEVTDPTGPTRGTARVMRGGSWANDPSMCRSAFRRRYAPERKAEHFGFRVALDWPP